MGWFMTKSDLDYESLFPADLLKDPWVRLQHRYYLPIALVMTFGVPTLIGWALGSAVGGFVYGGLIRVILNQHSTFLINSFCHMFGRQPYGRENTAKDSFLMSLFTFGEGYHNFHHHFQNDYRNGVRWYDWDPTKWFIRGMAAVGVCYRLKKVPQSNIAKARMAIELETLASKGVPQDRLQDLRQRVEQAHRLVRSLYEDYKSSKAKRSCLSTKAELRLAQIELRALNKQWNAYTRIMGRLSVAS
jgi:stearoyl-CoA desaturase (delta-9 desaturase)